MRKLCFLMAAVMLMTVMSGCSAKTVSTDAASTEQTTNQAPASKNETTSGDVQISAPGEFPIVPNAGDVKLKFLVTQHPAIIDWNTHSFTKWMEEKTNVKVEYEGIPLEGRTEKVNLVLASGNYPDVFFGLSFTEPQIQQYGVSENLLMPLNDLIDQNCVEIKKIWENFPGSREIITQLDGNIYSMPSVNECYHCTVSRKMWINQVWLDKLGLSMPTTTDEFYEVLKAFKEKDPNGNGKADEIALAGAHASDSWWDNYDAFLMNSFLFYDYNITDSTASSFGLHLGNDGNVTVPFYNSAEMIEGLTYLNKLYSEGLYYEGSFSNTQAQLTQLVENPEIDIVGAAAGGYGGMFAQLGGDRYKMFRAVNPLKGPAGYQGVVHEPYGSVSARDMLISVDCKYPEVAVKWGDVMYTLEGTLRSYLGVEGDAWRYPTDGEIGINGKPALYTQLKPWQERDPQNDHLCQQCIDYRPVDVRNGMTFDQTTDMYSSDGLEKLLQVVSEDYMKFAKTDNKLPPVKFTKEQNDEMMVMKTELSNTLKEYMTGFMNGTKKIDGEYDQFVAMLKQQGMDKLIEYYQNAYSAQYKK